MLKKSKKPSGAYIELYDEDGSPWLSSEAPLTKEQLEELYGVWLKFVRQNNAKRKDEHGKDGINDD